MLPALPRKSVLPITASDSRASRTLRLSQCRMAGYSGCPSRSMSTSDGLSAQAATHSTRAASAPSSRVTERNACQIVSGSMLTLAPAVSRA